jgi:hypothetical protein
MSSTPQHFCHGYIAAQLAGAEPFACTLVGLLSTANDLVAYPAHAKAMWKALKDHDKKWYLARDFAGLYNPLHHDWTTILIPVMNVHYGIDLFFHDKETGKWHKSSYYVEAGLWLVIIVYFSLT